MIDSERRIIGMKLFFLIFLTTPWVINCFFICRAATLSRPTACLTQLNESNERSMSVILDPTLTDERVKSLFSWVSRAFDGEDEYNNLMLGLASVFGTNLPLESMPLQMLERAEKMMKDEETEMGAIINKYSREQASLGAMGAGQWSG